MVNSKGLPFTVLVTDTGFLLHLIKSLQLLTPYPRSHAIEMAAACSLRLDPDMFKFMLKAIEVSLLISILLTAIGKLVVSVLGRLYNRTKPRAEGIYVTLYQQLVVYRGYQDARRDYG